MMFFVDFPELSRANLPNVKNILSNLDSSDKSGNNRPREGQYRKSKAHAQRVLIDLAGFALLQHFAYRGSSHLRKSTGRQTCNWYGLAISLISPNGEEVGILRLPQ
jgi:hypothetical protein